MFEQCGHLHHSRGRAAGEQNVFAKIAKCICLNCKMYLYCTWPSTPLKGEIWRVHLRPLNNIRSCCLPRPREGLLPLPSIHISANTHASLREIHTHHCEKYKCTTCGRDAMWCNVHTWDTHLHLGNAGYVAGKHENILSDKFSRRSRIGNLTREILSRPAQLIALFRKEVLPTLPEICLMLKTFLRLTRSVTKGRREKLAALSWRLCWSLVAQIYPNTTAASDKKASLGCPGHQAVLRCVG